jgi:DNA-binding IclR family transcriptional regulator
MNTSVRGADRALMIFEAFAAMRRQLTLREIAGHCDLPVSSCHALVQTLLQRGYLYTLGRRKELYPNWKLLSLAQRIVEHDPFLARFSADFEALRDQCGETVTVGKRQGDALQYIHTLDCTRPIRYTVKPGDTRPLHSTASGKALLSVLTREELEHWLEARPLKAITPKTVTSRQRLLKDIQAGRARGYFLASGEHSEDLDVIAVPVLLHNDVITVALAGPTHRMRPAIPGFAARLLALKKKLEADLAPQTRAGRAPTGAVQRSAERAA